MIDYVPSIPAWPGIQGAEEPQGFERVLTPAMLERASRATSLEDRQKVKEEFLAVFYKELLKQAITPPKFGLSEEESNSFAATFGSDLLVEKMALELARSRSFSADDLFPSVVEGGHGD